MPDVLDRYVAKRVALSPKIYAYSDKDPRHKGYLKVGFTAQDVRTRIDQQFPVRGPDDEIPYVVEFAESAVRSDGTTFRDHDLHRILERMSNVQSLNGEWFCCTPEDVRAAWIAVRDRNYNVERRTQDFHMRNEQKSAVERTKKYFEDRKNEDKNKPSKFLWNAKMRFGKTFAAYQLAKQMGFKRVLILTFKPAVESAWQEDLRSHVDFEGWQFVSDKEANFVSERLDEAFKNCDQERPIVVFGSFQNLLGTDRNGAIKAKNKFIHELHWDLVIFDEYHFGAWKDNAKHLFENLDVDEDVIEDPDLDVNYKESKNAEKLDETWLPITAGHYLYLSGTPFRAIDSGEFIEEQIYNWTYSDEQKAKAEWKGPGENPYAALPQMVMLTYQIPKEIEKIAKQGEFDEFDLNVFFSAEGKGKQAHFVHEEYVQKWLNLIRGAYSPTTRDELKQGKGKPAMPFSDTRLLNALNHTLWFLPDVASCYAMANLLQKPMNTFYRDYKINVCAGTKAGIGVAALGPVRKSMQNPLKSKTITLSCGKLTTGVTVAPWTGVFMLRNLKSPETYFQTAFRVQSPWTIRDDEGKKVIIKRQCYVFDFAPNRSLKQMADYSCRLNVKESNPEKKVGDFIHFLPVIAYDGSIMKEIDAKAILDYAMSGTSATLLARRWESALLVNVDNDTLRRLMANERAMKILGRIEAFRNLRENIEIIINKSEHVRDAKREAAEKEKELTAKKKEELSKEEKEYKSKRKEIQEKLIQLATRIPIFMYLTDCRELSLKDVIVAVEPGLFKKVTGLEITDLDLLCELNVFNSSLMNDAVYKFRRYEDASLEYTGINSHRDEDVGLFSTVLSRADYEASKMQ
jgi:hypothetical protein